MGREIHVLAGFCHGSMTILHFIGILYNIRKRNFKDVAIHTGAVIYGVSSTIRHYKDARDD